MAKKVFVGVRNRARGVKKIYLGANDVAHDVYKGYVGDAQGVARLFWERDRVNHYLRLNFEHDETGTFTFTLADIGLTVRYALEQWLLVFEGYRDPDIVANARNNIVDIMGWVRRRVPEDAYIAITVGWQSPSLGIRGGRFTLRVAFLESESLQKTVTGSEIVEGYKKYTFNTSGSVTWKYWSIGIVRSSVEYPTNVNPSTISQDINSIGLSYSNNIKNNFTCSNLGIYFTEYDVPVSAPLLNWKYQQGAKDIIRDRFLIYSTSVSDSYYHFLSTGAIKIPTWIYPYLYADITINITFEGEISLAMDNSNPPKVRNTKIFVINNDYGIYIVEDDIIPEEQGEEPIRALSMRFHNQNGQNSVVIESQVQEGAIGKLFYISNLASGKIQFPMGLKIEVSFEGYWNLFDYAVDGLPATSSFTTNPIEIGYDKSNYAYSANGAVSEIKVERKPISFEHIIFWTEFYHTPDGLDVQYNRVFSDNYNDFAEYLGTNKVLIYTYTSGTTPNWSVETRNFSNYARRWIRSPGGTTKSRIYIPINHLDFNVQSLSDGPYMRISARTYNNEGRLLYGMAYIENGQLVSEGYYHDADLINQMQKYYAHQNWEKVDYIWFEDTTDDRTLMISLVKIGHNWFEVK